MHDPSIPAVAAGIFATDLLRYLLGAGAVWLAVHVVFARKLASRVILDGAPRPGQVERELLYSMATVLIFAANGMFIYLMVVSGRFHVYDEVSEFGWPWWWASLALVIVAHDAYFYWTHRLLHDRRWFGAVHGRHHHSVHPTPWAAYSFHPIEAAVQAAFLPLFLAVVPMHGGVIAVFLVHMILRNAIGHSSHEVFPWSWRRVPVLSWITPVCHHHFHHARNRGNYSLYFTWWDRWCGTENPDYLAYGDARFGRPRADEGVA
jgi:Delta7-sterol 5-desaturase